MPKQNGKLNINIISSLLCNVKVPNILLTFAIIDATAHPSKNLAIPSFCALFTIIFSRCLRIMQCPIPAQKLPITTKQMGSFVDLNMSMFPSLPFFLSFGQIIIKCYGTKKTGNGNQSPYKWCHFTAKIIQYFHAYLLRYILII